MIPKNSAAAVDSQKSGNDREKSPKTLCTDLKRKCSEEEGQILSSGQLADKQTTEAEDVPETNQFRIEKRKDDSVGKFGKEDGQLSD